jgi:hypothetical protein
MNPPAVMSPGPPGPGPRPPRRWRRKFLICALVLVPVVLLGGSYAYIYCVGTLDLKEAMAEAERLDGPWRLPDIVSRRAILRDEENSSLVVQSAKQLIPKDWPKWPLPPIQGEQDVEFERRARNALEWSLSECPPPALLDEVQVVALRSELKRAQQALQTAHRIAELPKGRYRLSWTGDFVRNPNVGHVQDPRKVTELLSYDARLRAQDKDLDGAMKSGLAALNTARSLGDEPSNISQLVRVACAAMATHAIVRVLAQGEPSQDVLMAAQRLLAEDAEDPLLLYAARGERAGMDLFMEAVQDGEIKFLEIRAMLSMRHVLQPTSDSIIPKDALETLQVMGSIRSQRAKLLGFHTQLVEIGKLPKEEQVARSTELEAASDPEGSSAVLDVFGKPGCKLAAAFIRNCAYERCAAVAMALERYRRDHKDWPSSLQSLAPLYMEKVPLDPFDGNPLRYRRFNEGVVIYSVGVDGVDNGGQIDRKATQGSDQGLDFGFRLWDVKRRRQPAKPFKMPQRDGSDDGGING